MISVVFLYAVCALTFTLSKTALFYAQPFFFVALRMLIAGFLLLFYEFFKLFYTKKSFDFNVFWFWQFCKLIFQIAFFHVYAAYICDAWALRFITSSESALLYNLSPFVAALLSFFVLNEPLSYRQIAGMVIGLVGMLPFCVNCFSFDLHVSLAYFIMILAVVFSAYGWILVRRLRTEFNAPSALINGLSMFLGGCFALATSLFFENRPLLVNTGQFWLTTFLLIFFSNVLFYNWYAALLQKYTATFLAFAGFTCPLWVTIFGLFFLGEALTFQFFVSFLMIIAGLLLFYKDEYASFKIKV